MLTDFVCVKDPSSNQAALVFADKAKDGKQDVQCVVKTNTSTDCYFMPDLAACNTFRDSKQSMLAIHCSSTFCAKVPTLLQTASAATTTAIPSSTSKTCMQNKTVWTCSSGESSNATLVVLIGIMNDNVMCAADSSSGACKLFYSADNCMANCNAVLSDVAFSSKACQGSITSGISCDGGIISSTNTTTAHQLQPLHPLRNHQQASSSISPMTIALLSVVVALLIGSVLCFCRRSQGRRRQRYGNRASSSVAWIDVKSVDAFPTPTSTDFVGIKLDMGDLERWRLDETKLLHIDVLASGANGVVSLAKYNGQRVAVKKQLSSETTADSVQTFIDEIKLVARLDCPYIVHFIGVSWLRPREIELVVEYMEQGDLRNYLESNPKLPWRQKLQIAMDCIDGLLYLHSMDIIHRDLKARNVLLTTKIRAKLTDFGIARECNEGTMTQGVGTCRWMAPEVLEGNRYTVAADIYSFGMVLVELDTHLVPYMQLREVSNFVMMERLREGSLAPEVLDTCPPAINSLLRKCIAWDPLQRPSGAEVAATLRLLVGKL
ncbi:hypothetical protein AeRB84_011515 [Aphanomyces euteiches]|nr:hypothetical protein AeRB84_011515 [Aphanomyces euteiches]